MGGVGPVVKGFSSSGAGFWITLSCPLIVSGTSSFHTAQDGKCRERDLGIQNHFSGKHFVEYSTNPQPGFYLLTKTYG